MFGEQVVRQAELEIQVRSLVNKMSVLQPLFINQFEVETLKLREQLVDPG